MNVERTSALWILVTASLALLAGCTVGPNFHSPQTQVPSQWATPLAGGETNSTVAAADWWRNFHDPLLDSLMTRAVRSNLDLRIAAGRVREARAERDVVAGGSWPKVGSRVAYTENRYSGNGFPPLAPFGVPLGYRLYDAGFDASWELDVFGGQRRALQAATADLAAARYAHGEVLVTLFAEVARNYVEARADQQQLSITRQNLAAEQQVVDLTQNRYHAGLTSELDVHQATALLQTTKASIPRLETHFRAAVYELGVLLGQPPGALLAELKPTAPIPATPPTVPVGLPATLVQRRPDVAQAESQLAAATARIGVAKAELFPKFSLTGVMDLQSVSASDWFSPDSRFWTAGPTVTWRVFEAGRIRANVRVQNARQEQALNRYLQTVLVALQDVENALTAYAKEQTRHESLAAAEHADKQALAIAQELYRNGLGNFLSVLESERQLYLAQEALVQSERDISLDLIRLYKALGGGWQTRLPARPHTTTLAHAASVHAKRSQ